MRAPPGRLTPARRHVIDALLDQLLDLPAPARGERMRELSGRYPRIHAWLERLVASSDSPTSFLQSVFDRAGDAALTDLAFQQETLPPGTRIGDWRLAEPVGAGGMGLVYRAERADGAFEMNAAIKFIRSRDDALMAERLALETQLLARLDHPNIARVLDGGTMADGQTYLVMEWIEGEDLTDCRTYRSGATGNPGANRCLALFAEIAEAVAHAHQRQVVHGDIKPANIRIGRDGSPKLLDFGVARLISGDSRAPDQTEALTPAFSAPEQLEGKPISTQSDIYALGSLLRWMLTGHPGAHGEPVRPDALDAPRPAALAAIVNKATADDPDRRYRSVPELISDVRALVEIRPISVIDYGVTARFALWARRHQVAAGLAGLALAALIAGMAGIYWQAMIAAAERDAARFEAERSTLLREQLVLLFREVGQNNTGDEISTRELLSESARVAERLHANDPQMLVSIKALLGEIYISMNDFASADPLLTSFVNYKPNLASPLMQAVARADLAQVRLRQGDAARAIGLTDDALELLRRAPGMNAARIADVMQIQGQALRVQGKWDAAISTLREARNLARRESAPSRLRATTNNNLATTLIYAGRAGEAMPFLREALDNWRRLGLEDGSSALTVMANLAGLLHQRGELDEAEPLYREAIRRRTERFGESGALGAAHLNLGSLLATLDRIEAARTHVGRGMAMMVRFEGRESLNHVRAQLARGRVELAAGNIAQAREDLEAARTRFESIVGPDHLFTAIAEFQAALGDARSSGRATDRLAAATRKLEAQQPASNRYVAQALCETAKLTIDTDPAGARSLANQCLQLRRDELSMSEWRLSEASAISLAARIEAGDRDAIPALKDARTVLARALGAAHPMLAWCDRWLGNADRA